MAFIERVPSGFIHAQTQVPQSANVLPDFTLPAGHVLSGATGRQGWAHPLMAQKGFTHYDLFRELQEVGSGGYNASYPGRGFSNVPRINDMFGMTNATSQAQCEANANTMGMDLGMSIYETMEGNNFLDANAIQWQWFYDKIKSNRDAATLSDGRLRLHCHNYFRFLGGIWGLGNTTRESHRLLYTTPYANWGSISYSDINSGQTRTAINEWSPNGALRGCNLIVEGIYLNNPDADSDQYTRVLYAMDHARLQGRMPGIYLAGRREWHPNNPESTVYPEGIFTRWEKVRLPPATMMDYGFMSQEWGQVTNLKGCAVEWGVASYQPPSKKPLIRYPPIGYDENHDKWKLTGAGSYSVFPFYSNDFNGSYSFGGGDYVHFGVKQWHDTMSQVHAATPKFCRFRVDGGSWVEKSASESDLVDSFFDKRGLVRGRVASGKMGFWIQNIYASDFNEHTIDFQHPDVPGETFTRVICGSAVHSELITL